MRRRGFFKLLAGAAAAIFAPQLPVLSRLPEPAPILALPWEPSPGLDIRDILTQAMLADIGAEEDRLFFARVDSILNEPDE